MNCLLLESEELHLGTGRARVEGRRRRHAEEILRAAPGDLIRVGVIDGRMGTASIVRLDREVLELQVSLDRDPPAKRSVTLVLALPRPPVFRRLVSTIASLGIQELIVAGTARTEGSFWQSHVVRPEAIRERLLLGLEQSRDTRLPAVTLHRSFEALVKDVLPARTARSRALLAHPAAEHPCPHALTETVTLFVGPEGGFVDQEVERLCAIGFQPVHLGTRPLRVEPVVPMLIGRLCP